MISLVSLYLKVRLSRSWLILPHNQEGLFDRAAEHVCREANIHNLFTHLQMRETVTHVYQMMQTPNILPSLFYYKNKSEKLNSC